MKQGLSGSFPQGLGLIVLGGVEPGALSGGQNDSFDGIHILTLQTADDGDACAGADAVGTGLDHLHGFLIAVDTAAGLDLQTTCGFLHQGNVLCLGTAGGKAGGGLYKVGTGVFRSLAGPDDFVIGEQAGLQNDLEHLAGAGGANGTDISLDSGNPVGARFRTTAFISVYHNERARCPRNTAEWCGQS